MRYLVNLAVALVLSISLMTACGKKEEKKAEPEKEMAKTMDLETLAKIQMKVTMDEKGMAAMAEGKQLSDMDDAILDPIAKEFDFTGADVKKLYTEVLSDTAKARMYKEAAVKVAMEMAPAEAE